MILSDPGEHRPRRHRARRPDGDRLGVNYYYYYHIAISLTLLLLVLLYCYDYYGWRQARPPTSPRGDPPRRPPRAYPKDRTRFLLAANHTPISGIILIHPFLESYTAFFESYTPSFESTTSPILRIIHPFLEVWLVSSVKCWCWISESEDVWRVLSKQCPWLRFRVWRFRLSTPILDLIMV